MSKIYASVEMENLKKSVVDSLNQSPLSWWLKWTVLKEVYSSAQQAAQQEYQSNLEEIEKEKAEEEKQDEDEQVVED